MTRDELKEQLLSDPIALRQKKPFVRGVDILSSSLNQCRKTYINETFDAQLPSIKYHVVSQDTFLAEIDPYSHKVLFDDNVPSITMKIKGQFVEIEYQKMALPIQQQIVNKHVMHLCGNPMQFTLMDSKPTEEQRDDFVTFKQYWNLRNQDGMKTKMVHAQKTLGDAGLLFYMDYKGQIKSRLISYANGYVICSHNDDNGDRLLESIYYKSGDIEYIDSYDDEYLYRYRNGIGDEYKNGWVMEKPVRHGFSEIPLVTKHGEVAWNKVQSIIEALEVLYNIFIVIQKRHGWGILYVKGRFSSEGKKIAGAIVLNDTSLDGKGSAEFKTPPSPQGMIDTMQAMRESIQEGAGATFLLPKDVKMSGDISGVAIMLTQSLDIENALNGVIEWQNVADKMTRLFKEGLAKELVNKGEKPNAITSFENLNINSKFTIWKPRNDAEYNNILLSLVGGGILSKQTGIELNTMSRPDEAERVNLEKENTSEQVNNVTENIIETKTDIVE